jgi:hypothetical protein
MTHMLLPSAVACLSAAPGRDGIDSPGAGAGRSARFAAGIGIRNSVSFRPDHDHSTTSAPISRSCGPRQLHGRRRARAELGKKPAASTQPRSGIRVVDRKIKAWRKHPIALAPLSTSHATDSSKKKASPVGTGLLRRWREDVGGEPDQHLHACETRLMRVLRGCGALDKDAPQCRVANPGELL